MQRLQWGRRRANPENDFLDLDWEEEVDREMRTQLAKRRKAVNLTSKIEDYLRMN